MRQAAEAVWGLAPGECQPSHYENDPVIKELDGIARLRDVTHLLMATTSTRLEKVRADAKKLNAAETVENKSAITVSKWLITEKQLDAQHIEVAKKNKITTITLEQFRRRAFDGLKYLTLRRKAAFGSARDPYTDSITIDDAKYVELPITLIADKPSNRSLSFSLSRQSNLQELLDCINSGGIAFLLAPFGAGKSITTRQIFLRLAEEFKTGKDLPVPLALNLREHWAQPYADEMLERHARSIGYSPREDLTVAWRSGMANLLLDGFDEVAAQSIIRKDDKTFMREARREALTGVRDFLSKVPAGIGVLICGRDHYFDDEAEISSALSISGKKCKVFRLGELTESGVREFLDKNGVSKELPDWLPRKPLLLGYLIQKDLIGEVTKIDGSVGFGHAWDTFLTRITEREAGLESATMEAQTLLSVMERLAFSVRGRSSGSGPITGTDLSDAFFAETGQSAGEGVLAQLQRLPGLTQREQDPGSRSFVDEDMLAALQGKAFHKLVVDNFKDNYSLPIAELSAKAVSMSVHLLKRDGYQTSTLISVAQSLSRQSSSKPQDYQALADLTSVIIGVALQEGLQEVDFRGLEISSATFGRMNLDDVVVQGLTLRDCLISELTVNADSITGGISFHNCLVVRAIGIADERGLPRDIFLDCTVENFDDMATNNAVLQSNLPAQLKALMTVLRKLYKQAGGGRKMASFFRGITHHGVADYVESVVRTLEVEGFVTIANDIVHPVRRQAARVEQILAAPSLSTDSLVRKIREL